MKLDSVILEGEELNFADLTKYDAVHVFGFAFPIYPKHRAQVLQLGGFQIQRVRLPIPSFKEARPHVLPDKAIAVMDI